MWSPTHVQVTVCRAKGLLVKGKNGTNDAFTVIALGKEKFQTSVKQKAPPSIDWQEECELTIPTQGNTAEIVLTVLHQNFIGVDEFLGTLKLPLSSFEVYDHPKPRWYPLKSKDGQENKTKYRGELEVCVGFTVKSGSVHDLTEKEKLRGSFNQLTQTAHSFGGSLLNLGIKERKGIKKFSATINQKLQRQIRVPSDDSKDGKSERRMSNYSSGSLSDWHSSADPGVISEDEEEAFDDMSRKSSRISANLAESRTSPTKSISKLEEQVSTNKDSSLTTRGKSVDKDNRSVLNEKIPEETKNNTVTTSAPRLLKETAASAAGEKNNSTANQDSLSQRVVLGEEAAQVGAASKNSTATCSSNSSYGEKTREDLISAIVQRDQQIKDLNDYIDSLLIRVMDTCPTVLQKTIKGRATARKI